MPIEPAAFAGLVAKAAMEVVLGQRSCAQLARWVSQDVFDALARASGFAVRRGRPATLRLRAVRAQRVSVKEIEAAAAVDDGVRVRALALRARWTGQRWLVIALDWA